MTQSVNFGTKPVGWFTVKTATVINTSSATINRRIAVTRDWDDYSTGLTGSPCPFFEPAPLAPRRELCRAGGFRPSFDFVGLKQDQRMLIKATDPLTSAVAPARSAISGLVDRAGRVAPGRELLE